MQNEKNSPMTEAMFYVLLALLKPLHGYGIMERIAEISHGRIRMSPGTLYGILTRIKKDNYIMLEKNESRRKTYRLTAKGIDALNHEYERLFSMVQDSNHLIREALTRQ